MIRAPTDRAAAWAWWTAAIGGHVDERPMEPQCGLYRAKVFGQWRPAWIDLQQPTDSETGELIADERLVCVVDGVERDADDAWPYLDPINDHEFQRLQRAPRLSGRDLTKEVIT